MRYICAVVFFMIGVANVCAQSRGPELKLPNYVEVKKEAQADSLEERPYFILIDESEKALSEGEYADAALRLVEAMGVEPENPLNVALMSNLGMIYFYDNKDSLALKCLDKVVAESPKLIAGHENRARVLAAMGRDKEAFNEFGKVIELDSLNVDSRFYRGMMALYSGNLATAESDFAVLEKVVPVSSSTYLAMGTLYAMTSRELEAARYLRKLVEIAPEVEYYVTLINCYLVAENLADAAVEIAKALERYPEDGELYYCRARLNRARYDNDAAHRDAKQAIKFGVDRRRVEAIFK